MKKILSIMLAVVCLASAVFCTASCYAEETTIVSSQSANQTTNVTINECKVKKINFKIDKSLKEKKFDVSQSDKNTDYICASLHKESATVYRLDIDTLHVTKKPITVTVFYKNGNKKVTYKKYKVTVVDIVKETFPERKSNVGVKVPTSIYSKDYRSTLDIDVKANSIIKKKNGSFYGVKEGSAKYNVYYGSACVGSVKLVVGNYNTVLKAKYKNNTVNLIYNKHKELMSELKTPSYVVIKNMINLPKNSPKYSLETTGKKILKLKSGRIVASGTGKSTYTLCQKIGDKKYTIGKFTVNIKPVSMATVVNETNLASADGFFNNGEQSICLGVKKKYNLQKEIKNFFFSKKYAESNFKSTDYKITYTIQNKKIATVSKQGVIQGKKVGLTKIKANIVFTDKSVYNIKLSVSVEKKAKSIPA